MLWTLYVAATLCLNLSIADAVTFTFDENSWTKSTWKDFKINRPKELWRVSDDPIVSKHLANLQDTGYSFISAQGPQSGLASEGDMWSSEDVDARPGSDLEAELLSALNSLAASEAVLDPVCHSIVENTWRAGTAYAHNRQPITEDKVHWRLADVCPKVGEDVLERFALSKGPGQEWTPQTAHRYQLDRRRQGQPVTANEVKAVQLSCERLVKIRKDEFTKALYGGLVQYAAAVSAIVDRQDKGKSLESGSGEDETEGSSEEEPAQEEECVDRHQKCEKWADEGECQKNPNYMVGDSKGYVGNCRLSCGVCEPSTNIQRFGNLYLKRDEAHNLTQIGADLLKDAKMKACPEISTSLPRPPQRILLRPNQLHIIRMSAVSPPPPDASAVATALYNDLGGHCLYLNQGWWTYEVCFMTKIRQLHLDNSGGIATEHLIGSYREEALGKPGLLKIGEDEMSELGLPGQARSYVRHIYDGGAECTVNGKSVQRKAEVRIACSPRSATALAVKETSECEYMFTILVPGLCQLEDYQEDKSDHSEL
eukprot:evm.model.scf_892.7 EVM.evm.TU.scf_892.7   scf_892:49249-51640(+)